MQITIFLAFIALTTGLCKTVVAQEELKNSSAYSHLVVGKDKGAEFQLEARQVPLAQVLNKIAKQTQVPIHYSVLPEGLVTATCVGSTLKHVLACLLDHKADLIVRYSKQGEPVNTNNHVAEAWILGSRLDGYPVTRIDCVADAEAALALRQKERQAAAEAKEVDDLLNRTKSKIPSERADAIGALLAVGREGDPNINAALEEALHDSDATVRSQAISTLSHRDSASARAALQEALQDSSPDVRMMAVDGITDDLSLLQQAVNDSDETIRNLATMKLDELTKRQLKR